MGVSFSGCTYVDTTNSSSFNDVPRLSLAWRQNTDIRITIEDAHHLCPKEKGVEDLTSISKSIPVCARYDFAGGDNILYML